MSSNRDTNLCSQAIRKAWEKEKELVEDGYGTRDWTPEQQMAILNNETPLDEYGRPFEGHHMKNANDYPEYQGDPNNIQFLTRDEHLAAHNGNYQNKTNSAYNPYTGEYEETFGEEAPHNPYLMELSNPIEEEENQDEDKNNGVGEDKDEGQNNDANDVLPNEDESNDQGHNSNDDDVLPGDDESNGHEQDNDDIIPGENESNNQSQGSNDQNVLPAEGASSSDGAPSEDNGISQEQ